MKIYISIPITGHDLATQRAKAAEIAEKIKALGHEAVNPFDTPAASSRLDEKESYAYYMGEDVKRLLMCDAIFLCDSWNKSKGCKAEFNIAMVYGLADFGCVEDIPKERETDRRKDFLKEFSALLQKYNAKIDAGCFGRDSDNSFCSVTLGKDLELCWEEELFKKGGFRFPLTPDNLLKYNK